MITRESFWNHRAQNYDEMIGPMYEDAYRLTAEYAHSHLFPEDHVLDFACGTGIVTQAIAPHVEHIHAIDISEEMVLRTRAKMELHDIPNVWVSQTDLFDPCLEPGSFDAVMAFNVLLYVDNFDQVMARIRELLKPGGIFLSATDCLGGSFSKAAIQKFWRSHTGRMPYVGFFTQNSLTRKISQSGFEVLETENLFPSPPNLFIAAQKKEPEAV